MALTQFDEVSPSYPTSATAGPAALRRGNVIFGQVLSAIAATVDVLWEDGKFVETIPVADGGGLDQIAPVSSAIQGKIVYPGSAADIQSPEYRCLVVRTYSRQTNGSGTTNEYALLRSLQTGQMFEVILTSVQEILGQ